MGGSFDPAHSGHVHVIETARRAYVSLFGGDGAVRLVNASSAYGALDLYSSDTLLSSAIAPESGGSYVTLASGTYTLNQRLLDAGI